MREEVGDIWKLHRAGIWIAITTNGMWNSLSEAVMGRGVAAQAKQYYRQLPKMLGEKLLSGGNHVYEFPKQRIFSFPVKHHWKDLADLDLITRSADELLKIVNKKKLTEVALVRPGCGNGGLRWQDVRPIFSDRYDDRFVFVERSP